MLRNYYDHDNCPTDARQRRLVAVNVAVELVKVRLGASNAATGPLTGRDIKDAAKEIKELADAIQDALKF
ncbi:hypothetical protein [Yersinia sp. Marseille-Q3913]|uniref:hypothetical protein n=1 Tax=Yersinia TaxID=629 RepID=UPI001BAF8539|nr:hypothetical protein [Yersinia sp. Marseille-Q3913]MBS0054427.1 hypothetical protein [Yersinia sp. Marseille-Q3913]